MKLLKIIPYLLLVCSYTNAHSNNFNCTADSIFSGKEVVLELKTNSVPTDDNFGEIKFNGNSIIINQSARIPVKNLDKLFECSRFDLKPEDIGGGRNIDFSGVDLEKECLDKFYGNQVNNQLFVNTYGQLYVYNSLSKNPIFSGKYQLPFNYQSVASADFYATSEISQFGVFGLINYFDKNRNYLGSMISGAMELLICKTKN